MTEERRDDRQHRRATDLPFFNGKMERARALVKLLTDLGMGPFVVLVVLGMVTGYVPSPLTTILDVLRGHVGDVKEVVRVRAASDQELIKVLTRLGDRLDRQDRRSAMRECEAIKDAELRRECLRP
jgi:hypothetical protein